jgi:lambda family phage minor tail protein L
MAIPVSELQKLNPSARIELFVMELVEGLHYATGNPSSVPRSGSVITVTDLMIIVNQTTPHNDLADAKITRITTHASELDAANFPSSNNPFGTPSSNELPQEIFFIDRKTNESREIVQFELVGALDQSNKKLPARQVTRNEFPGVGSFING